MAIYKERKKWRVDIYVNGKKFKTRCGFATKKEAKNWHDTESAILLNKNQDDKEEYHFTFDELMMRYKEIHLNTISASTKKRYLIDIEKRIEPFFKTIFLKNITTMMIEDFKRKMLSNLSIKSSNNCIGVLKTIFKKAIEWNMITTNPCDLIKMQKTHRKLFSWWQDKKDIAKFIETAKTDRYYLAYRLGLDTKMRLGEIIGLLKSDIDLEHGYIHITRQWLEKEKCYGPPKHGKSRYIRFEIGSELYNLLKAAVLTNPEEKILFFAKEGGILSCRKLSGVYFQKLIEKSGVPRIRFHDLRHTFASWFMIERDNIWELKGILGHQDIMTTQIYAHLSNRSGGVPSFEWIKS